MNSQEMKEYMKEYMKAYRQAHREQYKARAKAYYQANKEEIIAKKKVYMKAYNQAHREEHKARVKAYRQAHKEENNAYTTAYNQSDLNSLGQTKNSIRIKSRRILKQMNLKIPHYEIHHCFGYEDASKFIYISRSLHRKIHQYLRDNNISADSNHWMQIRDIVNNTYEFIYIKA